MSAVAQKVLAWKPEYSVSVARMDAEHQKLFDLIGNLHQAMRQGKGNQVLSQTLKELADYTWFHFANEEKFLQGIGYPHLAEQKQQHQSLKKKVNQFQADFDAGAIGLTVSLLEFLNNWLITHIQGSDKRYGEYSGQI